MYWAEWSRLRDMLRSRGKSLTQVEDYRHALTRRALGVDKSSKLFTNSDLDKVLARLRAEIDPADLDAQLALQESPDRRRAYILERCDECCAEMWSHGNDSRMMKAEARQGYIRGTARAVIKRELDACTDADLGKVLGCLEARLKRLKAEVAAKIAAARGAELVPADEEDGNPF